MFVAKVNRLKIGAVADAYLLWKLFAVNNVPADILIPAQILTAVSIYRCIFPCRYKNNIVLHDIFLSSIFCTRLLATFAEIAWIYQLSAVIRDLNHDNTRIINILSWCMVLTVIISQCFVWTAIICRKYNLFFWEELGWALIFIINSCIHIYYLFHRKYGVKEECILVSTIFGLIYIPWQLGIHLPILWKDVMIAHKALSAKKGQSKKVKFYLRDALFTRNVSSKAEDWGGMVGMVWMTAYWIGIPYWMFRTVQVYSWSQ